MTYLSRRTGIGLAAVLVCAACQVEIQHGLSEGEANEILVLLERNDIPTRKLKEEGGKDLTWAIAVAKAHAANSAMLLKEHELPRPRTPGLEIFNKGSLIPTATEERAMFLQALSGELSRSLSQVDGVLDARVHVNIPLKDELSDRQEKPKPSASVLIKFRAYMEQDRKAPPPSITKEEIQELVARAVQDLNPNDVKVVMTPAAMPGGLIKGSGIVDVLGIRMAGDSVSAFRVLLGALVLVILVLAGYIVYSKTRELAPAPSRGRGRTSREDEAVE